MKNNKIKISKDKRGIAALIVVAIIGAVALIMSFSASWFGVVDLDTSYLAKKGQEVSSLADGCMDNALQRLKFDVNYSGETLSVGGGSCIISVTVNGSGRTIDVNASSGNYNQGLTVSLTLSGNIITINSWQEN